MTRWACIPSAYFALQKLGCRSLKRITTSMCVKKLSFCDSADMGGAVQICRASRRFTTL